MCTSTVLYKLYVTTRLVLNVSFFRLAMFEEAEANSVNAAAVADSERGGIRPFECSFTFLKLEKKTCFGARFDAPRKFAF